MTTEPKETPYDDIPGWTEVIRRIRNYPALAASHKRLFDACEAVVKIGDQLPNTLADVLPALRTAIAQAPKGTQ